jgi:hypothetical protein
MGARQSRLDRYYAGHEKAFERIETDLTKLQVRCRVVSGGWLDGAVAHAAGAADSSAARAPSSPRQPSSAAHGNDNL